jgi:hypothetical protein
LGLQQRGMQMSNTKNEKYKKRVVVFIALLLSQNVKKRYQIIDEQQS